jgi:tetratricopeptide (TPR) repeat protein
MPRNIVDVTALEDLREAGDYDKLERMLSESWRSAPEFDEDSIRMRILAAELRGRAGKLDEMEATLAPYLADVGHVPFSLAPRVLLAMAGLYYRRSEPAEALKLSTRARAIAAARDDDLAESEAIQLEGQALWSLERWDEAASRFQEAITLYSVQMRSYRLGLAQLCLGAVQNRMGRVEEARVSLERGIKLLLKCSDDYNLAVGRVNIALALNAMGEQETALKYLTFAHETFEHLGHEQYSYLTLNCIAATFVLLKDYDRAERYVKRALEKGAAARSTQIASTYEMKARVHIARREWDLAEKALKASLEIAEQANSLSQKVEARRTLGKLYLNEERDEEAVNVLVQALEMAQELRASLLELEIKALLAQAICSTNPTEACKHISAVEAQLAERPLPELRKEAQLARKRINSLDEEQYFILSDSTIPLLGEAKVKLLKWLWARALYKARGNAREAAQILGVTPTYIRKLTKVIPRDLLRPGRKRPRQK